MHEGTDILRKKVKFMSPSTRAFMVLVLIADFFAIIYFGGHFVITGAVLPHNAHAEENMIAKAEDPGSSADHGIKVAEVAPFDIHTFEADAAKGAKISGKCKACHSFNSGGKNSIGPNLWGIFNSPIMNNSTFSYSAAFQGKKGELVWDKDALNDYLKNPKKYIKGTKMAFPGIRKDADRAHLIAWLETLSE